MFHRRTVVSAIVCALLASALTTVAPAGASEPAQADGAFVQQRDFASSGKPATTDRIAAAEAHERYYSSYGKPATTDRIAAAEAQERYYSSYGEPESLIAPQPPQPSDDTPWLPIALWIAAALTAVTAGVAAAHRLRHRRRAARVTA